MSNEKGWTSRATILTGGGQTAHKKSNRSCPFCPHAPRTAGSCSPFCECCRVAPTQHHSTACEQCAGSFVSLCHHSNVSQRGERLMPVFALPARTRSWGSVCAAQQHHKQLQGGQSHHQPTAAQRTHTP